MERTINGMSFKEVTKKLKSNFDFLVTDSQGHFALSYEQIKDRMDDVLGLNYSFELQMQLIEVGNKKSICGTGAIVIKDDNGNIVSKRMHAGGADVILSKSSQEPVSLSNDYSRAATDIFKKVCKMLSLDGQLQELRNKDKYITAPSDDCNTQIKSRDDEIVALEDYNATCENKLYYKIKVKRNGKEGYLFFWKNQLHDKIIKAIKNIKAGYKFDISKMEISEKLYNNELQFHVKTIAA